jgi:hypothetical protein
MEITPMNDDNIERLNAWLKHLKDGIVLAASGHVFTWILIIALAVIVISK